MTQEELKKFQETLNGFLKDLESRDEQIFRQLIKHANESNFDACLTLFGADKPTTLREIKAEFEYSASSAFIAMLDELVQPRYEGVTITEFAAHYIVNDDNDELTFKEDVDPKVKDMFNASLSKFEAAEIFEFSNAMIGTGDPIEILNYQLTLKDATVEDVVISLVVADFGNWVKEGCLAAEIDLPENLS